MAAELAAELAAHDEAVAIAMEEKRRALMFETANVQKDVPFKIGDVVFDYSLRSTDDPHGAEAVVIGLPSKNASQAMGDRVDGAKSYVWIKYAGDLRAWKKWIDVGPAQPAEPAEVAPSPQSPTAEVPQRHANLFDGAAGAAVPELAGHERVRKKQKLAPPKGVRAAGKAHTTKESSVPVETRMEQYPNETFRNSCGFLFCGACHLRIQNIKGTIDRHIIAPKHIENKAMLVEQGDADALLKKELDAYFEQYSDEAGATLDANVHLMRYRITETFLATGTPLSRADKFRTLLERAGVASTASKNLQQYIPKIEEHEAKLLVDELRGQYTGFSFDGTTRLGEAVNIIARFCTKDFKLVHRLVGMVTTKLHLNNVQLANLVTGVILRKLLLPEEFVVNFVRDSASTNGAAVVRLLESFENAENILCICHTLCHVGDNFDLPALSEWMTPWLELVGGRGAHAGAKLLWKETVAPMEVPGFSNVRWYSKAEIEFVQARNWSKLNPFVAKIQELKYGDATTAKLSAILHNPAKRAKLRLELAAMLDMEQLVKTTYELEGDRLEILLVYRRVEALRALGRSIAANEEGCLPNVDGLLRHLMELKKGVKIKKAFSGHGTFEASIISSAKVDSTLYPGEERTAYKIKYPSDGATEDLEEEEIRPLLITTHLPERGYVIKCLAPGFEYLEKRLTGDCQVHFDCTHMYLVCELAQAFDPSYAAGHVDGPFMLRMSAIKPLGELNLTAGLVAELPKYLSLAKDSTFDSSDVAAYTVEILDWWKRHASQLPAWAKAARIIFALSPNSAACERVFSLLKNFLGDQQMTALADGIAAGLMLAYNKRAFG